MSFEFFLTFPMIVYAAFVSIMWQLLFLVPLFLRGLVSSRPLWGFTYGSIRSSGLKLTHGFHLKPAGKTRTRAAERNKRERVPLGRPLGEPRRLTLGHAATCCGLQRAAATGRFACRGVRLVLRGGPDVGAGARSVPGSLGRV